MTLKCEPADPDIPLVYRCLSWSVGTVVNHSEHASGPLRGDGICCPLRTLSEARVPDIPPMYHCVSWLVGIVAFPSLDLWATLAPYLEREWVAETLNTI